MSTHILGIRHHGVGSAKQVQQYLNELKPDIILVEGPPEITEMLHYIGNTELLPPVACMLYNLEEPKESTFYPFSEFSPEWVATSYANQNSIPIKAIDLPASHSFMMRKEKEIESNEEEHREKTDPLNEIAKVAGYDNGEQFWEHYFEQNTDSPKEHFESVLLTMSTLREDDNKQESEETLLREAFMRQYIRETQNEMYDTIAVICGAWHSPALHNLDSMSKQDTKLIKKVPRKKTKIASTWIPWTNSRLSMASGYGAGIFSPGWYAHNWKTHANTDISWLTQVASTFRDSGIDISTAHVMEAYRLALSLSSIRNKNHIGLDELNESIISVMCMGDTILLELIKEKLIIGQKLGEVPSDIPKVPLQEDFERSLKSLRLKLSEARKEYVLDLRKEADLAKSIFFHRLRLLNIHWAEPIHVRSKGTFKEAWSAEWNPELMINLIDKAFLGNTIESASQATVIATCNKTDKIADIADLIDKSIPAELFSSIDTLLEKINQLSAISSDIVDLMKALPQLIDVCRYGNVRKSDFSVLNTIVQQLLIKVFVGLPNGCYGLDEDNSNIMFSLISELNHSIKIYNENDTTDNWNHCLTKIPEHGGIHPIIEGCVSRLLLDAGIFSEEKSYQLVSRALSTANDPQKVAAWVEGFLRGKASILIYDDRIWNLLYTWVESLNDTAFQELLPMMRRAFSKFEYGERRNIGQKAKQGLSDTTIADILRESEDIDTERASRVIPVLKELMGR